MLGTIQSTMIRASAGSGKTWQLANRFLALMVLEVQPDKIIALTFTRKAAGEFTGRIMTRLADGATSDQGARALAEELTDIIHGTDTIPALVSGSKVDLPPMDSTFFQKKLEELISCLDRLALSTLDSYFVRIVRNFALELGLSGFDLMEDASISAERMNVMTSIFSNQQTTECEREAFMQSFKQATWGAEESKVYQTLEEFILNHQNRWLSAPDAETWGGQDLLWQGDLPYPISAVSEKGGLKEKAALVLELLGEPITPHKVYMNGWVKACKDLAKHHAGAPITLNAQLKRAIPIWQQYTYGGSIDNKFEMPVKLGAAISDLLGSFIFQEIKVRQTRTQGLYAVINTFEQAYHKQVRSKGRLCFSDLTLLLAGAGAMKLWDEGSRDLIDYRLDARYDHWMLDEFQDTSQPQWQAVGNLIDEIMQDAEGQRSVFVVGDSKQSIYGWRGGEPKLFEDIQQHYHQRLAEWSMDVSYRSAPAVLDLVNQVCDLSDAKWRDVFPVEAVERWVFQAHVASSEKQGHTLVMETKVDSKDPYEKTAARYAAMRDLILKVDPLAKGLTCAVLVNKNSEASAVVEYLKRELPQLPVASESESKISDGPHGALFLDLFRWLANPGHHFGRIHLSMSPLGKIVSHMTQSEDAAEQWRWLTEEISRDGVDALVLRFITAMHDSENINLSAYGELRLDAIHAAAVVFSAQGGSLSDWVQLLEAKSLRETTREGMIQVMTVHKCKGLGFDVVILPELGNSKKFTDAARLDALERKGDLGAIEYVIKKPPREVCEADPALSDMLNSWESGQCYESFCKLYVALTRAVHATYCIVDPVAEKWSCRQRYDDWIRESTAKHAETDFLLKGQAYGVLYESGAWLNIVPQKQAEPAKAQAINLQPATARMGRSVASAATEYEVGSILQSNRGEGVLIGNQVHQLFESITWSDELPDFDGSIAARLVRECLSVAVIAARFSRPEGDYQLLREQPFETQQKGRWISGVIDRAVITQENGQPSRIEIIDFKTDTEDEEMNVASLRAKYTDQLEIYRQAMSKITGVSVENISCYLLSTALKEMIEL
ncbi:MAG: UvrD-helicase domain-containing protein [Akkermansiaceae bacterium]